jgi:hypothetical protein
VAARTAAVAFGGCRTFKEVTCAAVVIQHLSTAHHQIDFAISQALVRLGMMRVEKRVGPALSTAGQALHIADNL